ncbi:MAG: serine/threonine protein phosphatase [Variibacter sp.]|nr:serine/threonine protein phosphatase [Variibacter sp.]
MTSFFETPSGAAIPAGTRIYAIADIHGCCDLLEHVLARIDEDLARHPIAGPMEVFLGDYVDRGPDSRDVINVLVDRGRTRNAVFLRGNHEALLLGFLQDPRVLDAWRELGGFATLLSYGVAPSSGTTDKMRDLSQRLRRALPPAHRAWLAALKSHLVVGDFFFVHAGVDPDRPLDRQREEDLLWIREKFLASQRDFGKVVVHGHTPVAAPEVHANRIAIDTGAFATGRLTCLVLEARTLRWLR